MISGIGFCVSATSYSFISITATIFLFQICQIIIRYAFDLLIILFVLMISTYLFRGLRNGLQRWTPRFAMNHIKDMNQQNVRVKMEEAINKPLTVKTNRVYKPSYTIEFNREGEVLLYSSNPMTSETLYFKYPLVLYESFFPLLILNYVLNPFDMVWHWASFGLYGSIFLFTKRTWYWADMKYHPCKLFLLRGGRVMKVQSQTVGGDRFIYWIENQFAKPKTQDNLRFDDRDEANFLTEQGQLKYDLNVQFDQFKVLGVNTNNQQLFFKQYGVVHHPQLFEAALKGYNIDTTDFVINTADNIRYREPNHNV